MTRWIKYLGVIAITILFFTGISAGLLYLKTRNSLPVLNGNIDVKGLNSLVKISRDVYGMPLIEATSMDDAIYATGFLHAQERFFQMDLLRRKSAGELAEIFGSSALASDKLARVHRFRHRAIQFVAALPADQRALLQKYVAGVNAGLNQLASAPFEYALLLKKPAPWVEEDTLLVNSALYLMLQAHDSDLHPELARQKLIAQYDEQFADFILSNRSEWDSPMQEGEPAVAESLPTLLVTPHVMSAAATSAEILRVGGISGINRATENIIGSNSWAVAGRKGVDGRALLANDMHLPLQQPNTFYRLSIRTAGSNDTVTGVSIPGIPALVAGSNGKIAWGLTNSNGDWNDLVRIDKSERAKAETTIRETIAVKWGSPVTVDVRTTAWGPVVASDDHADYAMNWVAHHAEGNNLALFGLMQAASIKEGVKIAAVSGVPQMNILFVDGHGGAAWTIAGRIPRRTGIVGNIPVSWDAGHRWAGWLEAAEYPLLTSADRDFFWTANNRVVSGDDWKKLGMGAPFAMGVRARRIEERLTAGGRADEAAMQAMQLDDTALLMQRWHGLLTKLVSGMPDSADKKQLGAVLAQWNGHASTDSAAYRVVRRFRDEVADDIMPLILHDLLGKEHDLKWFMVTSSWETPLWRVLQQQPASVLPAGYPSWSAYLQDVLMRKVYKPYTERYHGDLAKATWSDANIVSIRHPLSKSIPFIGTLLDMPSVPMNGDSNTILAQSQSFGPAMRMVVSPGHESAAFLTMPAGQAGNPLSPYYRSGHKEWQEGKTLPLLPGAPRYVLQLVPGH